MLFRSVRGFDWPASRLTPDCLQVQIQQGESGDTVTPVRVRTIPSGDDGRVLVQISSPQRVTDTVLSGRLSLLCGADYTREFTVLADTAIRGHDLDEAKASEAKRLAEEAMKNAKSDIDLARAQGEFAAMAAQIAAIQKFRRK